MNYEQKIVANKYPIEITHKPNTVLGYNWYARCFSVKYDKFIESYGRSIEEVCNQILQVLGA